MKPFVAFSLVMVLLSWVGTAQDEAPAPRPNVVVIMVDDMGYSDIGCYGGEIETPNIDRLAANGLRFTQFYNGARCCPTRASLLTGLYPHQTGVGHMTNENAKQGCDTGYPGYRGNLNRRCVTFAEVLGAAGYRTLMSGKWHVGTFDGMWPPDRGFDEYFGLIRGASNHWKPGPDKLLARDRTPVKPGEDFYTSDAFTDAAIEYVRESVRDDEEPFLLYLAYTAPHWPLHAPDEVVAKYRGEYRGGWDEVREARLARMIELGIIEEEWGLTARDARAWEELTDGERDLLDHRMAIYAAQVDRVDWNVGRFVAVLEELDVLDDTLLLFLDDNGGCAEGGELGGGEPEMVGTREGYWLSYGRGWANASNTPFRRYKHWVHEGGISSPLIVHWPAAIEARGELRHDPCHLVDVMATLVDVSGARYPQMHAGNEIEPMEGVSLRPAFAGEALGDRPLFWEHEGNRAVRRGKWKLVGVHKGEWELYDLDADRTELHDVASANPELRDELVALYDAWAARCHVRPWPVKRKEGYEPPPHLYPRTWRELERMDERR